MAQTRLIGKSFAFWVAGVPRGEPRHRYDSRSRRHHTDTSGPAHQWKLAVRRAALMKLGIALPPEEPLIRAGVPCVLLLTVLLPRPKRHYKGGKPEAGVLREGAPGLHTSKPDADNFAKAIMDALGPWPKPAPAIAWEDDSLVSHLAVTKHYTCNTPGVRVSIEAAQPMYLTARAFIERAPEEALHPRGEGAAMPSAPGAPPTNP